MQWNSWGEFWAMGGYGLYVWGSFGACVLGMALEPWLLMRRRRAIQSRLSHREAAR